jgi:hypothetical protein
MVNQITQRSTCQFHPSPWNVSSIGLFAPPVPGQVPPSPYGPNIAASATLNHSHLRDILDEALRIASDTEIFITSNTE